MHNKETMRIKVGDICQYVIVPSDSSETRNNPLIGKVTRIPDNIEGMVQLSQIKCNWSWIKKGETLHFYENALKIISLDFVNENTPIMAKNGKWLEFKITKKE